MKTKLFVSNLDFDVDTDALTDMFSAIGKTSSVVIAKDRETKKSKGYAFIEMDSEEDAEKAIKELNNSTINGRQMKVSYDRGKSDTASVSSDRGPNKKHEILPPIQRTQLFKKKSKLDPFMEDPSKSIDYRDVATLSKFVSERGKILSRRLTGLTAYNQRKVSKAIKRAQQLGLMPFSAV